MQLSRIQKSKKSLLCYSQCCCLCKMNSTSLQIQLLFKIATQTLEVSLPKFRETMLVWCQRLARIGVPIIFLGLLQIKTELTQPEVWHLSHATYDGFNLTRGSGIQGGHCNILDCVIGVQESFEWDPTLFGREKFKPFTMISGGSNCNLGWFF